MMYDVYFEFFGETICLPTEYGPEDFVDGFWIHELPDGGYRISESEEEAVYLIPPHRIFTIKKINEGD